MNDPMYNRLPHAGDFEIESGTEAFYLAPKPLPTGMAAFSGQRMHREFNDVFLDFAHSVSGLEFAVRASVGSHAFLMIFFFMVSGIAAWGRRHKEDFFEGWWVFFTIWPIWVVIGYWLLVIGYWLFCINKFLFFI